MIFNKTQKKLRRARRVRAVIKGTDVRPRLSVFRSNRNLYAQLVDDESGRTIFGAGDKKILSGSKLSKKTDRAREFGKGFARLSKDKKITKVVFDRSHYKYHGRVKAFAEGAREGGLIF